METRLDKARAELEEEEQTNQQEDITTWEGEIQEVETRISSLKEEVGHIKDKVKELRASRQDQEKLIAGHEVYRFRRCLVKYRTQEQKYRYNNTHIYIYT